jgi:hypothetical protein
MRDVDDAVVGADDASASDASSSSSSDALGGVGARERDEFFDEDADAADERAIVRALGGADAAKTDARLSCPGCFALVCVLCQRHERYKGQYRAVFARGVETSTTSCLRPLADGDGGEGNERYREVTCVQCGTVVAVQDDDDVYHFFNVFSAG